MDYPENQVDSKWDKDISNNFNRMAKEQARIHDSKELTVVMLRHLKEMTRAPAAIFSKYNKEGKLLFIKQLDIEKGLLQRTEHILGEKIKRLKIPVTEPGQAPGMRRWINDLCKTKRDSKRNHHNDT